MLTYLIPHYNRPYFLDIHVKLIRKYAPKGTRIIISDDGSQPEVVSLISRMDIDDGFFQKRNQNSYKHGTYSDTFAGSLALCKTEFLFLGEDDFFFSPNMILEDNTESKGFVPERDQPITNTYVPTAYNVFEEAVNLLRTRPEVINVQLARDHNRVPVVGELSTANMNWMYLDHSKKTACYYCNWPSMIRLSDFRRVSECITTGISVWTLEERLSKKASQCFGDGNWAVVPHHKHYYHVGVAFSHKLNSFRDAKNRMKDSMTLQSNFFTKMAFNDIESFNVFMLEAAIKGEFFIDFNELIEKGIHSAFASAFGRMSGI